MKTIIKNLWIAFLIACLLLGLWLYLYDTYEPVKASETSEELQIRIEAMVERDRLREEAPILREEIQRLRDELDFNIKRRDELNITINGEGFE